MGWEIWLWAGPVPVGPISSYSSQIFVLTPTPTHRKASSPGEEDPDAPKNLIYVVVHGVDIEPPVPIAYKTSIVGTRAEAAHKAHLLLQDESGPYALSKLCTCKAEETKKLGEAADEIVDESALDPETVEGFATAAQLEYRAETEGDMALKVALEKRLDEEEEAEVEALILEQDEDADMEDEDE
jgi:hypothetical protein